MTDYNLQFDEQFSPYMPQALGDPRRVRADKYYLFGIKNTPENVQIGRDSYSSEWESGGPNQNKLVSMAAIEAGFGDHSKRLRELYATFVSDLFEMMPKDGKLVYVEPGAGLSTKYLFEELYKRKFDLGEVLSYLLEPSAERLQIATEYLKSLGLKEEKDFFAITGRNYDITSLVPPESVDVVGSLATDHHEPDQTYPRQIEFDALKSSGFKINFDWCPPTCYHPQPLYQNLFFNDELDQVIGDKWPTKEQDRKKFLELFTLCLEKPPKMLPRDQKAWDEIMRYWTIGYIKAKMKGVDEGWMQQKGDPNDIFAHESHSTAEDVMKVYENVGFSAYTRDIEELKERSGVGGNPYFLLPDSGILAAMFAQKPNV